MKKFIAFGLLFTSFTLYSFVNIKCQAKQVYQYINDMGLSNYIEIDTTSDSIHGTYYGVEFNRDTVLVYFISDFIAAKTTDDKISFKLQKYNYGYKPVYPGHRSEKLIRDKNKLPFMLTWYCSGDFLGPMLRLQRIKDDYDNRADNMVFYKSAP